MYIFFILIENLESTPIPKNQWHTWECNNYFFINIILKLRKCSILRKIVDYEFDGSKKMSKKGWDKAMLSTV